jgi:hypothetical protein
MRVPFAGDLHVGERGLDLPTARSGARRSALRTAGLKLLGNRNWYLPPWLSCLRDAHIDGTRRTPTLASPVVDTRQEEGEIRHDAGSEHERHAASHGGASVTDELSLVGE